jgi:DNA-binding transcriptional LysR family regulator
MNVELRHLRTFIALAEELHFGRAAERLRITQPSLTQQIQRLETSVGTQLFERSTRRVEITPTGQELLRRSRDILAQVDEAFRRSETGSSQSLTIGFCGTIGYDMLPQIVAQSRRRVPELALTARGEMYSREVLNELRAGRVDLALVYGPVTDPEVATRTLRSEPLGMLLAADHPLAQRADLRITDFARERLVVGEDSPGDDVRNHVTRLCLDAGFRPTLVPVGDPLSVQAGLNQHTGALLRERSPARRWWAALSARPECLIPGRHDEYGRLYVFPRIRW